MPDLKIPVCDHEVVGALIINPKGQTLVFERTRDPVGVAFPCGHRDRHGTWQDALNNEVQEEVGLEVVKFELFIASWVPNRCRRRRGELGIGHNWMVFEVTAVGEVTPAPDEARHPRWVYPDELGKLARKTVLYAKGAVDEQTWRADPGLEPVWVYLLSAPGVNGGQLLSVNEPDRQAALRLAVGNQPAVPVSA